MRTLLVPVLLLAAPLAAQSPAPVDPARLQVARQLVTTMNIAATMDSAMTAMMTLQRSAQRGLPPFVFDSLMAAMRRDLPQLVEETAKIYADEFTEQELKAALAFYQSPAGRRMAERMPALTQRSTEVGRQWGEASGQRVIQRLQQAGLL